MIPFSSPSRSSSGNAFVYILVACVLLGLLTYSITRSYNAGGAAKELDDTKGVIAADSIQAYAGSIANGLVQLDQTGVGTDEVDFMLPSDTNFNTAPTISKLFHPDGGGINYKPLPRDAIDNASGTTVTPGFYVGRFNNVEWSATTAQDVIFTAWGINKATCAALNKKVTGSSVIPTDQNETRLKRALIDTVIHSQAPLDLSVALMPSAENFPAQCQGTSSAPFVYAFYMVLVSR